MRTGAHELLSFTLTQQNITLRGSLLSFVSRRIVSRILKISDLKKALVFGLRGRVHDVQGSKTYTEHERNAKTGADLVIYP